MSAPISHHVAIFNEIRSRIATTEGLDEDDQFVIDTAEGETELADAICRLVRHHRRLSAQAAGMKDLIADEKKRLARLEASADRLKEIAKWAMGEAGMTKLAAPDFSLTITPGRAAVQITAGDPSEIPDRFCRIKREANLTAIADALKAGDPSITFACLTNGGDALTVRSK